jgi:hypothetical protein
MSQLKKEFHHLAPRPAKRAVIPEGCLRLRMLILRIVSNGAASRRRYHVVAEGAAARLGVVVQIRSTQ